LQVNGRATLEKPLTIGKDYDLLVSVNCHKEEKVDLQENNKFNMVYKVKPTGIVEIVNELGQMQQAKPKVSYSKQWRMIVERVDDYELVMLKMIKNQDKVIDFISKLD